MNRNRWTALVLAIALLSAIALSAFDRSLDAQDKKSATGKQPVADGANIPFSGKVLLIQKKNDSSPAVIHSPQIDMGLFGFVLENAAIKEAGGIRFLTGHGIERVNGEPAEPRVSLPLEAIGAILEFDSVEAFRQFEEQQTEQMRNNNIELMVPAAPLDPDTRADSPDA
jgi:hypothetical protein